MPARSRRHEAGLTLIELIVAMLIMSIITTMLVMAWINLQNSYSYTVNSSEQRDSARQALSRMQAEVRDAQDLSGSAQSALVAASPYWIEFYTTFNQAGQTNPTQAPRLVLYRLYTDGTLWRFASAPGGTTISGVNTSMAVSNTDTADPDVGEETTGQNAQLLLGNVVNGSTIIAGNMVPLFRYMYYDNYGNLQVANSVSNTTFNDRSNTVAVLIRVLEDLNPGHAPIYADLQITAQLRNQR